MVFAYMLVSAVVVLTALFSFGGVALVGTVIGGSMMGAVGIIAVTEYMDAR